MPHSLAVIALFLLSSFMPILVISFVALVVLAALPLSSYPGVFYWLKWAPQSFLLLLHHVYKHWILIGDLLDVFLLFFLLLFCIHFHIIDEHFPFFCGDIIDAFLSLSLCFIVLFVVDACLFQELLAIFKVFVFLLDSFHFIIVSSENQSDSYIWSTTCMITLLSDIETFHFANCFLVFSICLK